MTDFVIGGVAAAFAGLFTNPLEVIKTRMQLQGELKAQNQYSIYYRNVFHAALTIAKSEGIFALQKGLVPALWYQLSMNGLRLGIYQSLQDSGICQTRSGNVSMFKCIFAGAFSGSIGAFLGSPIYLVKTQLQSHSAPSIAVGHQHVHRNMTDALKTIFQRDGIRGLWRGASGAIPRVMVGSASQLSTFSKSKQYLEQQRIFPDNIVLTAFVASMISGVVVTCCMCPFDVISTRLYNQGITSTGKGALYSNPVDCFLKIYSKEGIHGFYKGWGAVYFRLGPHTTLNLVFWSVFRKWYISFQDIL